MAVDYKNMTCTDFQFDGAELWIERHENQDNSYPHSRIVKRGRQIEQRVSVA